LSVRRIRDEALKHDSTDVDNRADLTRPEPQNTSSYGSLHISRRIRHFGSTAQDRDADTARTSAASTLHLTAETTQLGSSLATMRLLGGAGRISLFFARFLEGVKFRYIRFHDHDTRSSRSPLALGVDLKTVASALEHSATSTIEYLLRCSQESAARFGHSNRRDRVPGRGVRADP
jgi:hypothetical protein